MNQYIFKIHFLNDMLGNKLRAKKIECNGIEEFQEKANKVLDRQKISWKRVWRIEKYELQGNISGDFCNR
jgi:hypothetical protein